MEDERTQVRPGSQLPEGRASEALARLEANMRGHWERILRESQFCQAFLKDPIDVRLYAMYLTETYHYTRHNARNQAIAGARALDRPDEYFQFCLRHALEEFGHEHMALRDLRAVGFEVQRERLPAPLSSTQGLIGYLYWASSSGNGVQRLGYSYWAEQSYEFIGPVLRSGREKLKLRDEQMTFLISHARIDQKHAREVTEALRRFCADDCDWVAVEEVRRTSLNLTVAMLEEIHHEYRRLLRGEATRYDVLWAVTGRRE